MDWAEFRTIGGCFKAEVNPEQSELLQKLLFGMGMAWVSGRKEVTHTESRYLIYDTQRGLSRTNKAEFDRCRYNELFIKGG